MFEVRKQRGIWRRGRWAVSLVVLALTGAAFGELKTVEVTGQGIDPDRACREAMRMALEQGAGVQIASYTKTQNFELIRDTIFSRAEGIVSSYDILDRGEGAGGIYYCRIRAQVSSDAVAKTWGEVQNVLDQRGNPKIMVYIAETIDNVESTSSILESKIEERLIKSGFQVYDRNQLDAIGQKEADDAARKGNTEKMRMLAKGFATQIFVMGHANANQADHSSPHGIDLVNYNCDVQAKAYYTDTGKVLASKAYPVTRGGARGHNQFSPQAGKMAIHNAAEPLIEDIYEQVMKSWASEISFGGSIDIEIHGFENLTQALQMKRALADMPGVQSVNGPQYTEGMGVFRLRATMTGEDMAMQLIEGDWPEKVELQDASLNRIQGKWIGE